MPSGPSNNESLQTYHAALAAFSSKSVSNICCCILSRKWSELFSHSSLSKWRAPWIVELIQWMTCPTTLHWYCNVLHRFNSFQWVQFQRSMQCIASKLSMAMLCCVRPILPWILTQKALCWLCGPKIPKRMIETWDTEVTAHQSTVRVLYSIYERGFKSSKRISAIICFILLSLRLPGGLGPCEP